MNEKNKDTIESWKSKLDKPLLILGNHGSGKTTLAKKLLNKYTIITIDETIKYPIPYIDSVLNRKDISMMFSNQRYKALLFDDSFDINSILIKNIIKKKYKNTPIIITLSNINIKIFFTKFYVIKLSNTKNIQRIYSQKKKNNNYFETQYNTIGLNILDNIDDYNNDIILNVYNSLCIYDIYEKKRDINIFMRIDYSILFSCIIPIFYVGNISLKNNSYLSKSIIITNLIGIIGNNYESYYLDFLLNKPQNKKVNNIYKRLLNLCIKSM